MPKKEKRDYSLLIVSNSEQFNMVIKKNLPSGTFSVIEIRKSASSAKREMLGRAYDLVIVNAPLMDEFGVDFIIDIQDKYSAGIIVVVPNEIQDTVNDRLIDYGVITIPKPMKKSTIEKSLRIQLAFQNKLRDNEKKIRKLEDKMAELRTVTRAKLILIQGGMNEEEAERYIIKQAMDKGVKKKTVAEEIIEGDSE